MGSSEVCGEFGIVSLTHNRILVRGYPATFFSDLMYGRYLFVCSHLLFSSLTSCFQCSFFVSVWSMLYFQVATNFNSRYKFEDLLLAFKGS